MEIKELRRSATNKVIAGVCGGLGEYFEVDPTILRIVFVVFTFFGGSGILLYVLIWLVVPIGANRRFSQENFTDSVNEMTDKASELFSKVRTGSIRTNESRDKKWFAILLVVVGALFLFSNFGFFDLFNIGRMWPLVLITTGVLLLYRKK
ncbi:MAG: PspC domain-containing protein [bacterium]|nr:PspC domain-containing protein [bacterium]